MYDLNNLSNYRPDRNLLQNKTLLVTGAGDGIGKVAARCYAEHGARVILLGRNEKKLEVTYDDILTAGFAEPVLVPFDLANADETAYNELGKQISAELGKLDGLLHNAGILGELKPLAQYPAERFTEVLNINLVSNFLLTKAAMPAMMNAPNASIVFTSSSVGRLGRAYWGAYAISKFGVEGMMQTWADELENVSNVRCNSLNPGATDTAMRRQAYPAEPRDANPKPEQIMGAYLFLMGDDSIGLHGQQIDARPR